MELRHFNPYHDEEGKFATKALSKMSSYRDRKSVNDERIRSLDPKVKRLELKKNRLGIKRSKLDKKVNSARSKRELYGKEPTWSERKALEKAYKLDTKISKVERRQNKYKQAQNRLEYQNAKIMKEIDHLKKQYISTVSKMDTERGKEYLAKLQEAGFGNVKLKDISR